MFSNIGRGDLVQDFDVFISMEGGSSRSFTLPAMKSGTSASNFFRFKPGKDCFGNEGCTVTLTIDTDHSFYESDKGNNSDVWTNVR